MKNVKLGFQFAIGFYLGKTLLYMPDIMRHPHIRCRWNRIKQNINKILQDIKSEAKQLDDEIPSQTGAFPECKNKIGFTVE